MLSKKIGFQVLELPLAEDLSIDLAKTAAMFEEKPPSFVAVTAVSNVTGYILPHREIFRLARRYGAFNLLDGSQAVGLIRLPKRWPMPSALPDIKRSMGPSVSQVSSSKIQLSYR